MDGRVEDVRVERGVSGKDEDGGSVVRKAGMKEAKNKKEERRKKLRGREQQEEWNRKKQIMKREEGVQATNNSGDLGAKAGRQMDKTKTRTEGNLHSLINVITALNTEAKKVVYDQVSIPFSTLSHLLNSRG